MTSEASAVERAVFDVTTAVGIRIRLEDCLGDRLGAGITEVVFRSGRIDAVWGQALVDGRRAVVKAHRQPVDLASRAATVEAQRALAAAGFPCPEPVSGPDEVGGLVLGVEALAPPGGTGRQPQPVVRESLARGLHDQVASLRRVPWLAGRAGPGSAWCRHQQGPWPVPQSPPPCGCAATATR